MISSFERIFYGLIALTVLILILVGVFTALSWGVDDFITPKQEVMINRVDNLTDGKYIITITTTFDEFNPQTYEFNITNEELLKYKIAEGKKIEIPEKWFINLDPVVKVNVPMQRVE
jgi:hypothetical protein